MEVDIDIVSDDQRVRPQKSEVERLWADNSKARDLIGWTPQYAGVEGMKKGLAETIQWFTKSDNMKFYKADIYNV
jgi:dTDP-glucose 4,6-dehydratase